MKIKTAGFSLTIGLLLLGVLITSLVLMSLSRTSAIKDIWLEFEVGRSERLNAIISLRSEMGYDGMIHHFKNYILRQRSSDSDGVVSSIGGAKSALKKYKSLQLTATEARAVIEIEEVLEAYNTALMLVTKLIAEGKAISEIDATVKVDDSLALEAFVILESETFFLDQEHIEESSRVLLLNDLRSAMGYGGLIHNFKNYILRNSDEFMSRVNEEAQNIEALVAIYLQYDISSIERGALQKVLKVARNYHDKLVIIKEMNQQGYSPKDIDAAVIIDDVPALDGFNDLQRQFAVRNEINSRQLKQNVETVYTFGEIILYVTLLSFTTFIALTIWLLRYQIMQPLSALIGVMSRLSKEDLKVEVLGLERNTEIGKMARSVEVFKNNAIEKQAGEVALKEANEQLEVKVAERTKAFRINEKKLSSLVETAADAIITIDDYGYVQSFNAAAIAMFGYSRPEIVGKNINILMPEPYKKNHDGFLKNYMTTGDKKIIGLGTEAKALRKNGEIFPVDLAVSEIKDVVGGRVFTGIIRDVTEKKRKQQELQASIRLAEKASRAKSEFLSSVTHELRTPMNAVLGFSELLVSDTENNLTEEQLESVSYIKENGEQLLKLIEGVLDLSEIETGHAEIFLEPVNIDNLFSQIMKGIEKSAKKREISLLDHTGNDLKVEVKADYQRLKQVLLSLALNAIKYSPEQGVVTFTCNQTDDGCLRLSISDTGASIPSEELATIFEPFNWIDKSSAGISGAGVGLTICKELVELMEGKIGVFNNEDSGLTFWAEFCIP